MVKHISGRSNHTTLLDDAYKLIKIIDKVANRPKINIGSISPISPKKPFINATQRGNLVIFKIGTSGGVQEIVVSFDPTVDQILIKLQNKLQKHRVFKKYRIVYR